MKKAKTPPRAHTPRKHWYVLGCSGCETLTAVRKPFQTEAKVYSKKLRHECTVLRFERIPAAEAYAMLRAFAPCKPYGEIRRSISKALSIARGGVA